MFSLYLHSQCGFCIANITLWLFRDWVHQKVNLLKFCTISGTSDVFLKESDIIVICFLCFEPGCNLSWLVNCITGIQCIKLPPLNSGPANWITLITLAVSCPKPSEVTSCEIWMSVEGKISWCTHYMAEAWRLLCTCAYNGCILELEKSWSNGRKDTGSLGNGSSSQSGSAPSGKFKAAIVKIGNLSMKESCLFVTLRSLQPQCLLPHSW